MATATPLKVAYLFGAGATHAELVNVHPKGNEATFLQRNGLLMHQVSKRVCEKARGLGKFSKSVEDLLSPAGLSNVELFISLIESNEIKSEETIDALKGLIEKDIQARLSTSRLKKFYLHKALFELHAKIDTAEKLLAVISLNFDSVVDEAYKAIIGKPNYCLNSGDPLNNQLLKLHGGFGLHYRNRRLPIITPGINKNYLDLPYNFIWGRALEALIECNVLRVIGCSLSGNDIGLIDLLLLC